MFFSTQGILYLIIPMLLAMYASSKVKSTYNKYSKVANSKGYTGADVARRILSSNGIDHVSVERIAGNLTDHYDPQKGVLRLSQGVYGSTSIAALGIAAHECGHAIQDDESYFFLRLRHAFVPVTNFASKSAMPLAFLGIILGAGSTINSIGSLILQVAIWMFAAVVVFHVITLPVELDASRRAIEILEGDGYLSQEEIVPAKKVLRAAALTYIAAAAVALGNLLRFIMISRGRRR